ncbi:T6SS effector amidase Tae4 family protein [Campylobacter troglodytis]|uniref:T6SS effector amidase Tae4 family protein n=1 Tax=Campylobacter troglodytis TaxID=654363 RepID=UPI001FE9995A|nr:T6SS effector amidase Tae4 family protein [Campylobacter troglodytis]
MSTKPNTAYLIMPKNKPYTLQTTLKPNKIYSCFGIKIRVKEEVDTFSNEGNFEIHINSINLKEIEKESKGKITKYTPIFCYNQHSQETSVAKLEDSTITIRTNLSEDLINQAKEGLIKPCFLNLSFIPLTNKHKANNKASQKIQLTSDDINRGYVNVEFKLPLKHLGEWEGIRTSKIKSLPQLYASNDNMSFRDFVKEQEWNKFKSFYLNIHVINNNDRIESKNRIEQEKNRLNNWINSKNNIFGYKKNDFIDAEIRYYKIKGAIYELFMKSPYQRINTCTVRLSKALSDYGISIKRLNGMEFADLAYAGKNTHNDRILIKVRDMIAFLKANERFGKLEAYSKTNYTNFYHTFYNESYGKLVSKKKILNQKRVDEIRKDNQEFHTNLSGKKGIIALEIEALGDAFGHITLWENDNFVDQSNFLPDTKREYVFVKTLYFWDFLG